MRWFDVDGARLYLSAGQTKHNPKTHKDEPIVSRKAIYAMVDDGMRVAARGESGKRFWFCAEWIDAHLTANAVTQSSKTLRTSLADSTSEDKNAA